MKDIILLIRYIVYLIRLLCYIAIISPTIKVWRWFGFDEEY